MGDESKHNAGISDTNQKKDTVISELDSLRYTLNSGPEFQQDIPTLDDPYPVQSEQCDLFRGSDGLIHDPDLDIPILTDTLAPPRYYNRIRGNGYQLTFYRFTPGRKHSTAFEPK